jgi:MarR-like DNA-binding transcriptional regulator SgrR of sgrS sRNA
MGFTNIGSAVNTLVQLGISEALAAELRTFLETSATELTSKTPHNVSAARFGHSPASLQLAYDAGRAHEHVADAIKDMAAALQGYGTIVTDLYRNANEIDLTAKTDLDKKVEAVDACVPVSFAEPSQCTLPGSSSEGN